MRDIVLKAFKEEDTGKINFYAVFLGVKYRRFKSKKRIHFISEEAKEGKCYGIILQIGHPFSREILLGRKSFVIEKEISKTLKDIKIKKLRVFFFNDNKELDDVAKEGFASFLKGNGTTMNLKPCDVPLLNLKGHEKRPRQGANGGVVSITEG